MEEKRAWIMAVSRWPAYAIYVVIILGRPADTPLADVSYAGTLLWTVGGAIVASIVLNIVVSIVSPKDADKKDQRDREIGRFGEDDGSVVRDHRRGGRDAAWRWPSSDTSGSRT